MKAFLIVLAVLAVIYAVGFIGVWLFARNLLIAAIWPLWLLFGIFGNIQ